MTEAKIRETVGISNLKTDEEMKDHCTFRCGGRARYFVTPESTAQLVDVIKILNEDKARYLVMGRGSNLLIRQSGFDGFIINTNSIDSIEVRGNVISADAGASLVAASNTASKNSLSGLEFACAIPGSVGGAVFMNAGAHGGEIKDVLTDVTVFDGKNVLTVAADELDLSYRHSAVGEKGYTVLSARFALEEGNPEEIREKVRKNREFRKSQPSEPSAGSTFKRGDGFITAKLIDEAGLKGKAVGDACVSEKHAGFIVNRGNATADDVVKLIDYVKKEVYNKYKVNIEEEVRIL